MRELPALPEPLAALGLREQLAPPEPRAQREPRALRGQEQRSGPPEPPHWAPRLGLAALPEL